ncbi:hypothetical protein ACFL52_00970 [Candidatus Margulisiibacteriota bacterium]
MTRRNENTGKLIDYSTRYYECMGCGQRWIAALKEKRKPLMMCPKGCRRSNLHRNGLLNFLDEAKPIKSEGGQD